MTTCAICCDPFTKQVRKPIVCPVSTCRYSACQTCYKTFLTTDGVTAFKCMHCSTEFTPAFLREHFPEKFIKTELRSTFTEILVQRQIAQLPMSQPRAERELQAREKTKDVKQIEALQKELEIKKRILVDDIRFLRSDNASSAADSEAVSSFQRKCCDPACPGFVSSAWKCGICNKFSCAQCHEVKGTTREEIEAHVCDPNTVESIKFLKTDTKPCPACGTYIHKTEGCDQMFCISCKQLWSWKTGRIETHGHNPHYLEWMRNHGTVGLQRDPNDVQCGREIDRMFGHYMNVEYAKLIVKCRETAEYEPGVSLLIMFRLTFERTIPEVIRSMIHLQVHDIRNLQDSVNVERQLSELRVAYLCNDFNLVSFRRRVFNLHRNTEINRNLLDLLVAVKNAATDILYRLLDDMKTTVSKLKMNPSKDEVAKQNADYRRMIDTVKELDELHKYAETCVEEIYWSHSMKPAHQFRKASWFALTN